MRNNLLSSTSTQLSEDGIGRETKVIGIRQEDEYFSLAA